MSLAVDQYHRTAPDIRAPFGFAVTTLYTRHDDRVRFLDHLRDLWTDNLGHVVRWSGPGLVFADDLGGLVVKVAVARNTEWNHPFSTDDVGRLAASSVPEHDIVALRAEYRKDPTP